MEDFNEIVKITKDDNGQLLVSGRDLHAFLGINTKYSTWFERMKSYGFEENIDFVTCFKNVKRIDGARMPNDLVDHTISIDMAKELAMIQRTDKGKQARKYFIECEKKLKEQQNKELTPAEAFLRQAQIMVEHEREIKLIKQEQSKLKEKIDNIAIVDNINESNIRKEVSKEIKHIAANFNKKLPEDEVNIYKYLFNVFYDTFEAKTHWNLTTRLKNRRKNLADKGASKTLISKTSKLDIIADYPEMTYLVKDIIRSMYATYN